MITFTDKGILRKTRQAKITERVSEMENAWKEGRKRRETTVGGKQRLRNPQRAQLGYGFSCCPSQHQLQNPTHRTEPSPTTNLCAFLIWKHLQLWAYSYC